MLLELRISNFALIEDLNFHFEPGLNILSGETGAGKSVVVGAINLLLGERAFTEQIRQGEAEALVEGIISTEMTTGSEVLNLLSGAGIEGREELIVARELYKNGRSVARVNGRSVPASFLKDLGRHLIDLHGQHQHQSLLRPEEHLGLLDSFGDKKIACSVIIVEDLFKKRQELIKKLSSLGTDGAERERKLDLYRYQLGEIENAALKPGEDEDLADREKLLANAEKIFASVEAVYDELYSGNRDSSREPVIDRITSSRRLLEEAGGYDQKIAVILDLVDSAAAQLEEASYELRDYRSRFEYDPSELPAIQERRNLINDLKKKYGPGIDDINAYAERIEKEITLLEGSEELALALEQEIREIDNKLTTESLKLRELRQETAKRLEAMLEESLQELALSGARFEVGFAASGDFSARGMDQVEFLFSANRGEEVKALTKIISGGEVSRVMLAMKSILARQDLVPTLVFDEVDAGIGGATIQAVAEKLARLAEHHQVLCVTHSAQIAVMADCHYSLYKETVRERTLTRSMHLNEEKRREEIARMLDGAGIDQVGLKHVDSLLKRATAFKKKNG